LGGLHLLKEQERNPPCIWPHLDKANEKGEKVKLHKGFWQLLDFLTALVGGRGWKKGKTTGIIPLLYFFWEGGGGRWVGALSFVIES